MMVEINVGGNIEDVMLKNTRLQDIMKGFRIGIFGVIAPDDNPSNLVKFLEEYRKNNE